ncbi:MAG: hypothetical protein K2X84_13490, partial [Beijerinckiaceae bacterium]|nr:hypothetical protein [Beijerinckiaceae bacterium]
MRSNPAGDWTIGDIGRLCRAHGIDCKPPSGGGSHYKIAHNAVADILTIRLVGRSNRNISACSSASWGS